MLFSIVILTYNEEGTIGKLLKRLDTITKAYKREIILIDSESTDTTLEIVKGLQKKLKDIKVFEIKKKEFNHGETRNFAVSLAKGEFVCFISADALPRSRKTFGYFLEDLDLNKKAVAVFTKDVPYQDTPFVQKLEVLCRYEQFDKFTNKKGVLVQALATPFTAYTKENKFLWYALSNVFSCYRRSFLVRHPFPKTDYGEDVLIGKYIIESGYSKIYDSRCQVTHSHKYNLWEYYKRQKEDFTLRFSKLKLKSKPGLLCKLRKIIQLKDPVYKKLYFTGQLVAYYLIKLLALAHARLSH